MREKIIKKKYKGSYTVEASFLLPMILTVIVLIIYMSFFLHDRAVLQSAAYTSALRGSQMISGEKVFSEVENSAKKLIANRLIGTDDVQTTIDISGDDVKVSYKGIMEIPAGALLCSYLAGNPKGLEVKAESNARRQNAVKLIRRCRIIEKAAKGMSK